LFIKKGKKKEHSCSIIRIVGFNGREIKKEDKKEPVSIRSPISCDFIKYTVARITAPWIKSTEKCKGCGKVTKGKSLALKLHKKCMRGAAEHASGRLIALQAHMDLCVQTLDSCNG